MTVVADAGPLIALSKLGLLHLLGRTYDRVLLPPAVYDEVVTRGLALAEPDAHGIQLAIIRNELTVVDLEAATPPIGLNEPIQLGERQAIRRAVQESAQWLLIDDLLAREQAKRQGLHVKGTLGIILHAHKSGLLQDQEVELVFATLLNRSDIWISDDLVRRVRQDWRRQVRRNRPSSAR